MARRKLTAITVVYLALALYCVGVIVLLRNFTPVFDGWTFYRDCFMHAAATGDCSCQMHTAYFPTLLYGAVAYVFPYSFTALAIVNLALGLSACFMLARVLAQLFPAGEWFCHATTAALILNPVMLAQAIQPNLDYLLAILTAFLIAALLRGNIFTAMLLGLLMTSTKESGVMLYGVSLIGFMGVAVVELARSSGFRRASLEVLRHAYTILPLFVFILYAYLFNLHGSSFGRSFLTLGDFGEMLLSPSIHSDILIAQLLSLFVLNFNWLLTTGLLVGTATMLWRPGLYHLPACNWFVAILVALFVGIFFHTSMLVYNVPRYVLPLFVLLLCGVVIALSQLRALYPRLAVTIVVIYSLLLIWSQFYTVDPISKTAFRTFKFGSHEMLSTGGFRKLPEHGGPAYVGNNQLIYNLQFIKFGELAEEAVRQFGFSRRYVVGPAFTWQEDFARYDQHSGVRSMRPDAKQVDFSPYEWSRVKFESGDHPPFIYLEFPNVLNDKPLDLLMRSYEHTSVRTVSFHGYSIQAHEFGVARESNDTDQSLEGGSARTNVVEPRQNVK